MSYLSSPKTPQNPLRSLFCNSGSTMAIGEFGRSTSGTAEGCPQGSAQGSRHDKTAGQPFCTAAGCPQGGVQGGTHDKTAGQPFCTAGGCPQGSAQGGAL